MKLRTKKTYPNDFKTVFGVGTMGMMKVGSDALMTAMFMAYLTDYAGIGAWGAVLGTILLLVGRIFDAVNDPLQGWIMDSAKVTKFGKYKIFCIYSVLIIAVSVVLLFNLPVSIATKPILVVLWTAFFYLAYDFGSSFYALIPMVQSLSEDEVTRSKLIGWNRIISVIIAIPMSFFLTTALMLNEKLDNIHNSIGIMAIIWLVPVAVITLIGTLLIKEGKHVSLSSGEPSHKVTIKEISAMLKSNKAMTVHFLSKMLSGFMWTIIFATEVYYLKWAYCADLTTGVVDTKALGNYMAIVGMMQILPVMIAAALAAPIARKLGSSVKSMKLSLWVALVPGFILFALQMLGILQKNIGLFIVLLAVQLFGIGLGFVPDNAIWLECVDYNAYSTGKEMGGLVNAIKNFLEKAQNALSTAIVGGILIAIGYNVNSVTGDYQGDLSAIPSMLNWFIVVSALLPSILALTSILIYKRYPITPAMRVEMKAAIEARRAENTRR